MQQGFELGHAQVIRTHAVTGNNTARQPG